MSRQHIYRLLQRYHEGGLDAVEPRSRRPASNPHTVSDEVITAMVHLREQLTADGLDAGPVTLQWHLQQAPTGALDLDDPTHPAPPRADHPTAPQTPRSSYIRFAAAQPNECWQSDFTHWPLADGTDVEILNWLDDHSRYLLSCTAHRRVTGPDVVATFTTHRRTYGLPASTLTDNGTVYTARFTDGHNDFERLLAALGITQKNGHPGHPQTQGKIERFHQTLKRWLAARPRPATIADLQTLLDHFRVIYNTATPPPRPTPAYSPQNRPTSLDPKPPHRPHPPSTSASATTSSTNSANSPCATAAASTTSASAATTPHTPVLILVTTTTVTVISKSTHQLLSSHAINPDKNYWPNQQKNPGRWPGNL